MPRTFFESSQPTLKQQIEHGIRLWHDAAAARGIKNYDEFFLDVLKRMDVEHQRKEHDAIQETFAHSKNALSPTMTMREGKQSSNLKWWEDDPESKIVSESEIRERILLNNFSPLKAQNVEMLVLGRSLVPLDWKIGKSMPHEGFYISAHYFAESGNFLDEGAEHSAWVSLTRAYYYLGINSSLITATEAATIGSNKKHKATDILVNLIVEIAKSLESALDIKAIGYKKATQQVAERIAAIHGDALIAYSEAHHGESENASLRSLEKTLGSQLIKWINDPKTHPEIRVAFLPFKSSRGKNVKVDDEMR